MRAGREKEENGIFLMSEENTESCSYTMKQKIFFALVSVEKFNFYKDILVQNATCQANYRDLHSFPC